MKSGLNPYNPRPEFLRVNSMYEDFNTINRNDGNVILIFSEQLLIRFDVDLLKSEPIIATGVHDHRLRLVAEMASGT